MSKLSASSVRPRLVVAALCACVFASAACTYVSVPEDTVIVGDLVEAPLRRGSDGFFSVELDFPDGGRRRAVFDTGSGILALREYDADALGFTAEGSPALLHGSDRSAEVTARSAVLAEVRLDGEAGAARFLGVKAFAFDKAPFPCMVGATLFDAGLLTLDFARERLRFEPGELPEADGATILDYEDVGGVPAIEIDVGDVRLRAIVDSGFNGGLGVSESDAAGLRVVLSARPAEFSSFHGSGQIPFGRLLDPLRLGMHTAGDVLIVIGLSDALVGLEVLQRFVVTFDRRNQRVRFVPVAAVEPNAAKD